MRKKRQRKKHGSQNIKLFETTYIIPFIIVKEVVRLAIGNRREMRHCESNEVNHRAGIIIQSKLQETTNYQSKTRLNLAEYKDKETHTEYNAEKYWGGRNDNNLKTRGTNITKL